MNPQKSTKNASKIFKTVKRSTYRQKKDENQELERKIANLAIQLEPKEVISDNPLIIEREREKEERNSIWT
ncbi:hypothetical protein [endosymbiont GvMRE of Glomus versiforme]|uniref:hypothetical protein n=1 Tax=endosymbiont GvMRE of Glomus versiforme TaxID=2039283 RepID=UPI000EC6F38D|nr:hypothetical protein [endosymbiont GvMRE of Glomus versiforme]RHZ36356.1 hypothetical protein GvMRE_Ic1g152 [endosymbiont GvMRE of Glomus versiforme]